MVFDPFTEERPRPSASLHEIGQDLSLLSLHELDERIEVLEREIERLREAQERKQSSRAAASAFFKT